MILGLVTSLLSKPQVMVTAAIIAAGTGWFGGGQVGYSIAVRVAIVAGAGVAALMSIILALVKRKRAKKLEEAVLEPGAEPAPAEGGGAANIDLMRAHFKRSLQAVKDSPHGRNALLTMPWYLMIGPPGAGKTSLMQHSGMVFPQIGLELQAVPGVGGTRNCDWWFTEDAIYLDTAGRFTSQAQSRKEWQAFLSLVSGLRRKRPISGIVLTVGLDQLLNLPEDKVAGYAQEIRRRYDEVAESIDFVFPVYLVFNKSDLVDGFCDYFDHLDRNERAEPFGYRLPFKRRQAADLIEDFRERYRRLGRDLLHRRTAALNRQGMDVAAKRRALCFPGQFEAIEERLVLFLEALLGQQPFKETGILRGVHFTSAVQLGTPVDRIGETLEGQLNIEFDRGELDVGEQKVYFLQRLFSEVFLPDRKIGFLKSGVVRRNAAAFAIATLASLAGGIYLIYGTVTSAKANHELVETVGETASQLTALSTSHDDILAVFDKLDTVLGQLKELAKHRRVGVPTDMGYGLYQGEELYASLRGYYFDQIRRRVLMRIRDLLVEDMDQAFAAGDRSFDTYRDLLDRYHVYRMLTDDQTKPVETVMRRILINEGYWQRAVLGDNQVDRVVLERIEAHGAYVAGEAEFQNEWLIDPVGQEVGGQLRTFDWIANAHQDMERTGLQVVESKPMSQLLEARLRDYFVVPEVPGMYTQDQFQTWVAPEIAARSEDLVGVLELVGDSKTKNQIRDELIDLYRDSFHQAWAAVHAGIQVRPEPFIPLNAAVRSLGEFASSTSPYRSLYQRLINIGQLRVSAVDRARSVVADVVPEFDRQREWMDPALKILLEVRDHVQAWSENTSPGTRIQQVDELERLIEGFGEARRAIAESLRVIDNEAIRAAKERELVQIFAHVGVAVQRELEREANNLWLTEVVTPAEHLAELYPFDKRSADVADPAEVTAFWHPETGTVATVLDQIEAVSRLRLIDASAIELDPGFRRARRLLTEWEQAWFDDGVTVPTMDWKVSLVQRAWNEDMAVAFGDQRLGLYDSPTRSQTFVWSAGTEVPIALRTRADASTWYEIKVPGGPWSLVRLLDQAEVLSISGRNARVAWYLGAVHQTSSDLDDLTPEGIIRPAGKRGREQEIPGETSAGGDSGLGGLFGSLSSAPGVPEGGPSASVEAPAVPEDASAELAEAGVDAEAPSATVDADSVAGAADGVDASAAEAAGDVDAEANDAEPAVVLDPIGVSVPRSQALVSIECEIRRGPGGEVIPLLRDLELPERVCP